MKHPYVFFIPTISSLLLHHIPLVNFIGACAGTHIGIVLGPRPHVFYRLGFINDHTSPAIGKPAIGEYVPLCTLLCKVGQMLISMHLAFFLHQASAKKTTNIFMTETSFYTLSFKQPRTKMEAAYFSRYTYAVKNFRTISRTSGVQKRMPCPAPFTL